MQHLQQSTPQTQAQVLAQQAKAQAQSQQQAQALIQTQAQAQQQVKQAQQAQHSTPQAPQQSTSNTPPNQMNIATMHPALQQRTQAAEFIRQLDENVRNTRGKR